MGTNAKKVKKTKGSYRHGDLRNVLRAEALRLIQERQQVDFNLRELSKLAGVTHTAVYRHYRDKRELLAQIALEGFQKLLFEFQETAMKFRKLGKTASPEQGKVYVRFALKNPGYFRAMFHPSLNPFIDYPDLYATAKAAYQEVAQSIQHDIERGIYKKGPVKKMATIAWSSVHGLAQLILDGQLIDSMTPTSVDVESISEYMVRSVEASFLAKPTQSPITRSSGGTAGSKGN